MPETAWEILFDRAVELISSARERGVPVEDWSFGGGTVLMRRHRHRLSKDIDIFIGDYRRTFEECAEIVRQSLMKDVDG